MPSRLANCDGTVAAETKRVNPLFEAGANRYVTGLVIAATPAGNPRRAWGKTKAENGVLGLTQLRRGAKNAAKNKFRGQG